MPGGWGGFPTSAGSMTHDGPHAPKRDSTASLVGGGGVVGLLEALGLLANQADELVVAVVVQHAVELVAVIRDYADRVDRDVVNFPFVAVVAHQVVHFDRLL